MSTNTPPEEVTTPPSEGPKTDSLQLRARKIFKEWWSGYSLSPNEAYTAEEKASHMEEAFLGGAMWASESIAHHEASKENPKPSPQVGMGVGLPQDASIPTPETRVTGPGFTPHWIGSTQPASDSKEVTSPQPDGVFKGAQGLQELHDCDSFWERQMYGTRFYFGDGGSSYLHRGVLRAFLEDYALAKSRAESAETQLASLQTKHDVACQTISQMQNERMHRDSFTALSNLSAWLSQGAGDETTTPDEYEGRIRAGVDQIIGVEVKRREEADAKLSGAEAHIAALEGQLRELVKRRENDEAKLSATKEQLEETEAGLAEWVARANRLQKKISQSPWISTSERMPTREDGDRSGYIFRMGKTNPYLAFWNSPPTDDLWMPIPPIPTAEAKKEEKPSVPKFRVGQRVWIPALRVQGNVLEIRQESVGWIYRVERVTGWPTEEEIEPTIELSPAPWTLPSPPEGQQWHRSDGWTQEMLPEGWRPLLKGEKVQEGDVFCRPDAMNLWLETNNHNVAEGWPSLAYWYRTRRPLPAPPAPKKRVPLEHSISVPEGVKTITISLHE